MQAKSKLRVNDLDFMQKAIDLAYTAKGKTHPNPAVGALIVKSNKVIAAGCHKKAGRRHAEIDALKKAGPKAKGASLYVSLEPCSSYGKTPPCTEAIIKAGIKKVFIAQTDTNPLNAKKGIKALRQAGIEVTCGLLEQEAYQLNEDYNFYIKSKYPFVTLKIAQTLDGKMATARGDSKWISSKKSREIVHRLRVNSQAVLTGIGTILKDNPRLNSRIKSKKKGNPVRIILDSQLKIPLDSKALINNCPKIIIFTNKGSRTAKYKKLIHLKGVEIITLKPMKKNKKTKRKNKPQRGLSLKSVLRHLAKRDIVNLLVEAGPKLASAFINESLVNKLIVFTAPKLLLDSTAIGLCGGKKNKIKEALKLKKVSYAQIENDILMEAYL
jgi:diaminohydroxyphosphoribosylaminopyrimidine deaminase/5-amino-6-(5-phosphoribosylamino)uracil reductase